MTAMPLRAFLAALTFLVLTAPVHAAPVAAPSLRLSDLRTGYRAVATWEGIADPRASTFYVDPAAYDAVGAQETYTVAYCINCDSDSVRIVDNSISRYTSAAMAHEAFDLNVAAVAQWHLDWVRYDRGHHIVRERDIWHAMNAVRVGAESACWMTQTHDAVYTNTVAMELFRQGNYLASVRILSRTAFPTSSVVALASVVSHRL